MLTVYEAVLGTRGLFSEWRRKQSDVALARLDAKLKVLMLEGVDSLDGSSVIDEVGGGLWRLRSHGKPKFRIYLMKGPDDVRMEVTLLAFAKKNRNVEEPASAEADARKLFDTARKGLLERRRVNL